MVLIISAIVAQLAEQLICNQQVGGSSPLDGSTSCGSNSIGRVSAFQADCCGFESRLPLHFKAGNIINNVKAGNIINNV